MSLFKSLMVYHDHDESRSAALNMAIDEALLEHVTTPSIRFYRWSSPALSFGYFGKFADLAEFINGRDIVRRWTGGGIVPHGEDLTYSIVVPMAHAVFLLSSKTFYEETHRAMQRAFRSIGRAAELAAHGTAQRSESCFVNAVPADVLLNGRKIAGAAQRRTRRGLLQQGSIQNVPISNDFPERFANQLGNIIKHMDLGAALLARARDIAEQKYAARTWLERR